MELQLKQSWEPPMAQLKKIGFDTMTSDEIKESSIFEIHENVRGLKSLCDNRLGLPNSEYKCATCKVSTMQEEHQCPGHFGHFSLSVPIYNPLHIQTLVRLLNKICPSCGKKKPHKQKKLIEGWIQPEPSYPSTKCKYCVKESDMTYPDIKFKIVKKRLGTAKFGETDVDTIEMHVDGHKPTFPSDCWSFIDKSIDVVDNPRLTRPLLPAEAIQILENASTEEFAQMRLASRPETLIMKDFLIPPNCLRFVETSKAGTTSRKLDRGSKTQMLASILSLNNSIKPIYSDLYVAERDSIELQARVLNYFKSFKIFANEKEQAACQRNKSGAKRVMQTIQRVGPTWFKKNILGKRTHYSAIAVVTGDPNLGLQHLAIPHIVAKKLKVPVTVTRYNLEKLKDDISKSTTKISIIRDKKCRIFSGPSHPDLQIGDVMERSLLDGDLIFANRSPTIHMHSFIGFEAKIENRHSFGINPTICSPLSADFDGDILHMYVPQSLAAKAEVTEMLKVSRQMKSPQGGQSLLGMSEDGLLSSYLMLQTYFWIGKYHMQMLNMYCDSGIPIPAIVKSPEGTPLWTGLQLISMTLPPHLNSKDFVISNSEILECPADRKRLMKNPNGIVQTVLDQAGPEETSLFLIRIQNVLHEWLSVVGFSVGLKDLLLAKDFKSRKKLMGEVETGLEEARDSSRRAVDLFSISNHMDISCGKEMVKEGSMASRNNDDIGIEAFQTVFQDIQTTVERYGSSSNPMLAMVKSGSRGSLIKLVQQSVCLGLQLLDGKRWFHAKESMGGFWEYPGIIESSFLDGLKYEEFLNHVISKRCVPKGYGIEGAGELFRSCMFGMRELCAAYDGSVRTRNGNHIVQFCYDSASAGGEAVGALAVTAVIEPTYKYTFDQSVSTTVNPITLLKETLSRGTHSKLKPLDLKYTLRISSQAMRKKHDWERAALKIQCHLQRITLGNIPFTTMIEHNFERANSTSASLKQSPWLIHIHISQETLRRINLKVGDILSAFCAHFSAQKTENFHCSEHCEFGSSSQSSPCILVHYDFVEVLEVNTFGYEHPNFLKYSAIPSLSRSVLRGSPQIKTATIQWEDYNNVLCNTGDIPKQPIDAGANKDSKPMGELVVEVSSEASSGNGTWRTVTESCCGIMELVDWQRSGPYSISEVCSTMGIEAARKLIYERLKLSVQSIGGKVHGRHLSLIADYMTHSGKVLALTATGMKLWNKEMGISAPFTEGAFADPKRAFFDAARNRKTEELYGLLSSIVWGKSDGMGENDFFDLMWCHVNDSKSPGKDYPKIIRNEKKVEKNIEQVAEKDDCLIRNKEKFQNNIERVTEGDDDKIMKNKGTFEENIVQDIQEDDIIKNKESVEKINVVEDTEEGDMYCPRYMNSDDLYMDMEYPPGFSKRDDANKSFEKINAVEDTEEGDMYCPRYMNSDDLYMDMEYPPGFSKRDDANKSFEKINAVEDTEEGDLYCPRHMNSDDLYMDMEYPPGFSKRGDANKSMDIEELPPGFEQCESTNIERFSEGPCDQRNQVISELTVSVQNILHHRYRDGQYLEEEDMEFVKHKILIHHPNLEQKIGCGITAIRIGRNLKFPKTRCFVLVREDGSLEDFSYHKCLQNITN